MKSIKDIIKESVGAPINSAWLDSEKPVQTKDGRPAVVFDIDISVVPNIVKGKVKNGKEMTDYEWNDDGTCIKATDSKGNPVKPSDIDTLVKGA